MKADNHDTVKLCCLPDIYNSKNNFNLKKIEKKEDLNSRFPTKEQAESID